MAIISSSMRTYLQHHHNPLTNPKPSLLHLPLQQHRQLLPPLPPPVHPILPIPYLRLQNRLMPLPQTLERSRPAQLEQPDPIIRQRPLQLHLPFQPLRARQNAYDLPVDLEAVEEVGEVFKVGRGCVLTVDVEPDEAGGVDGAAVYLCEVDGVDVGEAGADEGDDGGVVGCAEGCAGVVRAGDVDGGGVNERRVVDGVGQAGHGRVGRHWGALAEVEISQRSLYLQGYNSILLLYV